MTSMKLASKSELKSILGSPSLLFPKKVTGVCEYIAGIPDLDNVIQERTFNILPLTNFEVYPGGLGLSIMHKFKMYYTGIANSDIKSIHIEGGKVLGTENKSVVGRAIVGGLLLGPLGAIIGGASGVGERIIKNDDTVTFLINTNGHESAIVFNIKKGKLNDTLNFFKQHYRSKLL